MIERERERETDRKIQKMAIAGMSSRMLTALNATQM